MWNNVPWVNFVVWKLERNDDLEGFFKWDMLSRIFYETALLVTWVQSPFADKWEMTREDSGTDLLNFSISTTKF